MGVNLNTGAFAWALVACAALVALSGVDCGEMAEHPAAADMSSSSEPATAVGESTQLDTKLALAKNKNGGAWTAKIVGPRSLLESICSSWATAGKCMVVSDVTGASEVEAAFMKKHCASECANPAKCSKPKSGNMKGAEKAQDDAMKGIRERFKYLAQRLSGYMSCAAGKSTQGSGERGTPAFCLDGVGDTCKMVFGEGAPSGGRGLLQMSSDELGEGRRGMISRMSGVKRCNTFYTPNDFKRASHQNSFRLGSTTYKMPVFVCQTTIVTTSWSPGHYVGGDEVSELGEALETQVTTGRRGKATTIRRGGGFSEMTAIEGGGGFYIGNNEEDELGEGRREAASTAIVSNQDVQALGVCEHDDAVVKLGATCAAAAITQKMVDDGLYDCPNGNCSDDWKKENKISVAKSPCLDIFDKVKGKCRPPANPEEGKMLMKYCMASMTAA